MASVYISLEIYILLSLHQILRTLDRLIALFQIELSILDDSSHLQYQLLQLLQVISQHVGQQIQLYLLSKSTIIHYLRLAYGCHTECSVFVDVLLN